MAEYSLETKVLISRVLGIALFCLITAALFTVFSPFIKGFAWAVILVLMTWPVRQRIRKRLPEGSTALLMSLGLALLLLSALTPVALQMGKEINQILKNGMFEPEALLKSLEGVPVLGPSIASGELALAVKPYLQGLGRPLLQIAGSIANGVFDSLVTLGMMLLFSFFLYRCGDQLFKDLQSVLGRYGGKRWLRMLGIADATIRGVVYGAFVTAFAQGLLAGIGFFVAGAPMPALLGISTVIFSFIPFGAPIIYVPVVAYLVLSGSLYAGLGLLLWCVAVVSTVDNILRPLFISQAIRMSVLVVFMGIVGGILAFGLIGLFIGPTVAAIAQAGWQELVRESKRVEPVRDSMISAPPNNF
jgi:predicted PurR-regulated permease PerM